MWIEGLPITDYTELEEIPTAIMYSEDGRTIAVEQSEIEAYKAVGWYTRPVNTYAKYNGNYSGGGIPIPDSIYAIGQWHADISEHFLPFMGTNRYKIIFVLRIIKIF